jgi:hypothetical protein
VTHYTFLFHQEEIAMLRDTMAKTYNTLLSDCVNQYCSGALSHEQKRRKKSKTTTKLAVVKRIQELNMLISQYGSESTKAQAGCCYSRLLLYDKKQSEVKELLEPLVAKSALARGILDQLAQEEKKLHESQKTESVAELTENLDETFQILSIDDSIAKMEEQVSVEPVARASKKKKSKKQVAAQKEQLQDGVQSVESMHTEPANTVPMNEETPQQPDPYDAFDIHFIAGKQHVKEEIEKFKNYFHSESCIANREVPTDNCEHNSNKLFQLGMQWLEGTQGEQNIWLGINFLKRALALDNAQAAFILGGIYRQSYTIWGLKKDIDVNPMQFGLDPYITKTPPQFIQRTYNYCQWYAARALRSQKVKLGIEHALDWSLYDSTKMDQATYANLIKDETAFHAYTNGAACAYFEHCILLSSNSNSPFSLKLVEEANFYADNAFNYLNDYEEPADTSTKIIEKDAMETVDAATQEIVLWLAQNQS